MAPRLAYSLRTILSRSFSLTPGFVASASMRRTWPVSWPASRMTRTSCSDFMLINDCDRCFTVDLLVDNFADVRRHLIQGLLAIDLAIDSLHPEIIQQLLRRLLLFEARTDCFGAIVVTLIEL